MKSLLLATGLAMVSLQANAHHSRAIYDLTRFVTIEGTVKQWQWTNPHSAMIVTVIDAKQGTVDWTLEGGSPSFLARDGWKRTDIAVGDHVKVMLRPNKDGTNGGSFSQVTLPTGKVLKQAIDLKPGDSPSPPRKRAEDEPL